MDYETFLLKLCELFVLDDYTVDDDALIQWIMNMGEPSIYSIQMMKDRGNSLFKDGNLSLAASLYKQALIFFCFLGLSAAHSQPGSSSLALSLVLNLAACELKLSHFNQAWCFCNLVLDFEPSNVKALYRRGLALRKLDFFVEALSDFEHALKLEPSNKDVSRELNSVVDYLALKPNGKRVAYHFDPLGNDRKGKKPLLNVDAADTKGKTYDKVVEASCSRVSLLNNEMQYENVPSCRSSDVIMDSVSKAETYPPMQSQCDSPSVSKSSTYKFSSKNQVHKNLYLSSKDYDNLMSGRNLQFYHPKSGAYMKVRPLSPKTSILTGTPHEQFSWEAEVPSFSPLTGKHSPSEDFGNSDEEATHRLNVKRPCLSHNESSSNNNEVCEVAAVDVSPELAVIDDCYQLPSETHFVFSSLKKFSGNRCRRYRRSCASHRSGRDQAQLKSDAKLDLSNRLEVDVLSQFQSSVQQCVANRGLGLTADIIDHCKLKLKYPEGTNSTWVNEQFKKKEPLEYEYDVCEAILLWEQYRNVTMVLTREYLDVRPDGWLDYAAKRIAQLGAKKCYNQSLCDELLSPILPSKPPFHPQQFERCAVVGNSGDLLLTEFGEEIDSHDAVIRDNEAPVNEKYAKYVGMKRTFRLGVRGTARNMIKILEGAPEEVFIIKSLTHRDFNEMIKSIPNPVYLFQGIVLRRGAKGTGMKSIELALSMCNIVDIYGFTVDPGYKEWTRYFSEPRKGHNPLQGRAYYQLLECLGVIRIHSPMRAQRNEEDWSGIPSQDAIKRAHSAAIRLKQSETGQFGDVGQFRNCKFWGEKGTDYNGPVSGSPNMSEVRKKSNYSKWELMPFESLRKETREYYKQMEGVSLYKIDGNKLDDLVCIRHPQSSED